MATTAMRASIQVVMLLPLLFATICARVCVFICHSNTLISINFTILELYCLIIFISSISCLSSSPHTNSHSPFVISLFLSACVCVSVCCLIWTNKQKSINVSQRGRNKRFGPSFIHYAIIINKNERFFLTHISLWVCKKYLNYPFVFEMTSSVIKCLWSNDRMMLSNKIELRGFWPIDDFFRKIFT